MEGFIGTVHCGVHSVLVRFCSAGPWVSVKYLVSGEEERRFSQSALSLSPSGRGMLADRLAWWLLHLYLLPLKCNLTICLIMEWTDPISTARHWRSNHIFLVPLSLGRGGIAILSNVPREYAEFITKGKEKSMILSTKLTTFSISFPFKPIISIGHAQVP